MSQHAETDPFEATLFKATIRLSGATDSTYVLARNMEDAVDQVRKAHADMNVLYIQSVERLAGTVYITPETIKALQE